MKINKAMATCKGFMQPPDTTKQVTQEAPNHKTKHTLINRGVCHLDQLKKVEIKAVIKYLCKKGMSPKKIHEYL
jgi:hypothetical protein